MTTNFPNSVDAFTNPTSGDTLDNPPHDQQHADINDAMEAVQTKIGVDNSAVTTSLDYLVRSACPVGSVMPFAGSSSPDATWLICDGSAVSRTTYATLFALLGTTYGSGDGSTTFNIPNMKGRVPVGFDSGQTEFDALGETGGAKTHTLTESEMPSHTHTQNPHNHTTSNKFSGNDTYVTTSTKRVDYQNNRYADSASFNFSINNTTATNQNTGGGNAHNNLQPYIALNYIMKAA